VCVPLSHLILHVSCTVITQNVVWQAAVCVVAVLHLLMTIYYHNWYIFVTLSQCKILLTQNKTSLYLPEFNFMLTREHITATLSCEGGVSPTFNTQCDLLDDVESGHASSPNQCLLPFESDTDEKLTDCLDEPCGHSVNPWSFNIISNDPLKPSDLHEYGNKAWVIALR